MKAKFALVISPLILGLGLAAGLLAMLILLPSLSVVDAQGAGAIQGRVYDGGGMPLAYADVWAEPYSGEPGGAGTQADANGYYTLSVQASLDYRVGANKDGYVTEFYNNVFSWDDADPVGVTEGVTTTDIDFFLDPGGVITGTVMDASGTMTVTNAWVNVNPADGAPWGLGTTVDGTGAYTVEGVPVGQYVVQAQALGYLHEFYQEKADWPYADVITVTVGSSIGDINFTLIQGAYIKGRVYDGGGSPLANANVWAEPYGGGAGGGGTQADEQGYYTITVAAGEYRIAAEKPPYIQEYYPNAIDWAGAAAVSVAQGATQSGIDFHLDLGGMITGTVTDTGTGGETPIRNANVHASPTSGEPWGRGTNQIDHTGVYTISGLPPGFYKVEAYADGYDVEFYDDKTDWGFADEVEVTAGGVTGNVNFTLQQEQGGEIFGTVVLPNGNSVPFAHVDAESFDHMQHKGGGADENGNFRIGGLASGDWLLRAYPPGDPAYADYGESQERQVVIVATSSITLSSPLTLTTVNVVGRAVLPDGSGVCCVGVDIHSTDFSVFKGTGTDHEGYFRVGGLPAGDYKVELHVPWGTSGIVPPPPRSFSIGDPDVVVDLGDIAFIQAVKHIVGRVVRESGEGVPNVEVNASRRGMDGWAWTQTDDSGNFDLDVSPGTWEVMIHAAFAPDGSSVDWVFSGFPKLVTFDDDPAEETQQITFTVQSADAQVVGQVEGPNGEPLRSWAGWVDVRDFGGRGNGMPIAAGGRFTVPVAAGTYHVWIGVDERTYPDWSGPQLPPFNIASGETYDLGLIRLIAKNSAIEGRVTVGSDDPDALGVAGLSVHAWQHEGGWGSTTTDANGYYHLSIVSGTWEVDIEPPYTSTYVTGQPPQRVDVGDDETKTGVDFVLQEASGVIQGTLCDPDGNLLTTVDGWAYARQDHAPEPIASAPVINGQFSINVPHGTYRVGVWLPPNSGYTAPEEEPVGPLAMTEMVAQARTRAEVAAVDMSAGERFVSVQAETTVFVNLTLLPNDARIVGAFYTDDAHTQPVTSLMGEVFAMSGMGGAWQAVPIDPIDGSFELEVAAGTWNLGYWIESTDYVNSPPPDARVTIRSGEVFTFNFTIVAADATIEGIIKKPDGDPLNHAWAWAHRERTATSAAIDTGDDSKPPPDGHFSIRVPSGGQYEVGAHAPEEWGYIQPDFQVVTPTAGSSVNVVLQFRESNATIEGTVYYHDQAGNDYYGPWVWVWAWSDDGQHTGTPTDAHGNYRLNVIAGTTWHVGAAYHPEQGSIFYETTAPVDVVMTSDHASVDLHLYRASTALPPAVVATFDPSIGWTHTLSDGTRIEIPPGAMPTTDTVRISVTPLVEELKNTLTARPFGFGYAIAAYKDSTGNQIVQSFNANVLITFYYTEDELRKRGVSEDNLSPAYFSTTTNSWTKVESFSVDKTANRVTVQINHFSTWALTSSGGTTNTTYDIYLPLVLRN